LIIAAILTLSPWSTGKPITKSQTLTIILRVGGMNDVGRARFKYEEDREKNRGKEREESSLGREIRTTAITKYSDIVSGF